MGVVFFPVMFWLPGNQERLQDVTGTASGNKQACDYIIPITNLSSSYFGFCTVKTYAKQANWLLAVTSFLPYRKEIRVNVLTLLSARKRRVEVDDIKIKSYPQSPAC